MADQLADRPGRVATDQLADRLAILDLMHWYGVAIDAHDWDLFRSLFTPDAVLDYTDSGALRAGLDETIEFFSPGVEGFAGMHHANANHVCEIDGDTARALTYFTAVHAAVDGKGGEVLMTIGGTYRDKLVRTPGGWRIAERVERGTWMSGDFPEGYQGPGWYGTPGHRRPQLPD
jgi:hypothetical protein